MVLKWASEYGLSFEVWGSECLLVTPLSVRGRRRASRPWRSHCPLKADLSGSPDPSVGQETRKGLMGVDSEGSRQDDERSRRKKTDRGVVLSSSAVLDRRPTDGLLTIRKPVNHGGWGSRMRLVSAWHRGTLQIEPLDRRTWPARNSSSATAAFYNRRRTVPLLATWPPIEFESRWLHTATQDRPKASEPTDSPIHRTEQTPLGAVTFNATSKAWAVTQAFEGTARATTSGRGTRG